MNTGTNGWSECENSICRNTERRAQHIFVQIVLNEVTEDAYIERDEEKMSIRDMNFFFRTFSVLMFILRECRDCFFLTC